MAKKRAKKVEKKVEEAMESCCIADKMKGCSCGGSIYGLGAIGAVIYHISTATGFFDGVWGIIQALLWPAFLIFDLMKFLAM